MRSRGIVGYSSYVPRFRLRMADIASALRSGSGKGERSVAGPDEDTTTMGAEAARMALAVASASTHSIDSVWFSTTVPTYADKTNATAIHAALGLDASAGAYDLVGSVRSTCAALIAAFDDRSDHARLVVGADLRGGPAGSPDERAGGDGAGAMVIGSGAPVALLVARGSASREFLDRWRAPGEWGSNTWEERFGETIYPAMADLAIGQALGEGALARSDLNRVAVAGPSGRSATQVRRSLARHVGVVAEPLAVGSTGAAEPLMALGALLDQSEPGETIALIVVSDGADCFLFRTTDALAEIATPPAATPASSAIDYPSYLTWRGELRRQAPRRPEPDVPVAPASGREEQWKFGFQGSTCQECSTVHLPPSRVCGHCGAIDQMVLTPVAGRVGTVAATTVDHLAWSLDPPVVVAIVDFDGGGRVQCEVTDLGGADLEVGDRVSMVFRVGYTVNGIANYVWKARPVVKEDDE